MIEVLAVFVRYRKSHSLTLRYKLPTSWFESLWVFGVLLFKGNML